MDRRLHRVAPMSRSDRALGFTLIEVTIAAGLLVTIALGSAQMFALALRYTASAKQQLVMSVVASRKIDELSAAATAGTLAASPPDALERSVAGFTDVVDEGNGRFVRRWLVTRPPPFDDALVAVVVRVMDPSGWAGDVQVMAICNAGGA